MTDSTSLARYLRQCGSVCLQAAHLDRTARDLNLSRRGFERLLLDLHELGQVKRRGCCQLLLLQPAAEAAPSRRAA